MKTKTPRKAVKPKVAKNKAIYTATLKIFGKKYSASGSTKIEAIANLNVTNVAKGMSVLTLSKGSISKDRLLPPRLTARLFVSSRLMREVAIKQVSIMFDL